MELPEFGGRLGDSLYNIFEGLECICDGIGFLLVNKSWMNFWADLSVRCASLGIRLNKELMNRIRESRKEIAEGNTERLGVFINNKDTERIKDVLLKADDFITNTKATLSFYLKQSILKEIGDVLDIIDQKII